MKLTEEQDPKQFHRVKYQMMSCVMISLDKSGYDKTKKMLLKSQLKSIFDIIDDGSLPEKETKQCVIRTLVDYYNESANFIGEKTINVPKKYR